MTDTLTRPHPAVPPAAGGPQRPHRARPSRFGAAALGVAFILVLVGAAATALASFEGKFGSYATVTVALPQSANAVSVGNPVDYRDIQVGTVTDVTASTSGGAVRVVLHLDPADLDAIPADVHAAAIPLSIFGTQYIELQAPAEASTVGHLVAGQFIPASASSGSSSLQTTVANIDDILTSLHPADLSAAFDALATALNGEGHNLGVTMAQAAAYLGQLLPQLPTAEADLGLFGSAGTQLTGIVPSLLQATGQFTTTAQTITADQQTISSLLNGGPALATAANTLLTDIATPYQQIAADITPLLQDVSANPQELSQVLSGFTAAAAEFAQAASHGPYLQFSGSINIYDDQALVYAGLGGPGAGAAFEQAVGPQNFNPPSYTSAQCPTYGSWTGPNCGASSSARSSGGTTAASAPTTTADTPATDAAVEQVATGLEGGHAPPSEATAVVLLAPLLASLGGGS